MILELSRLSIQDVNHQIVQGKINFHVPKPPKYKREIWDYKKGDVASIRRDVQKTNWPYIFLDKNVDEMTEIFTDKILSIAGIHIPSKIITVDDKEAPWVSPTARAAIKRNIRVYTKVGAKRKNTTRQSACKRCSKKKQI